MAYSPSGDDSKKIAFNSKELNGGFYLVPTWGIRRNISYRWNFELSVGFGIDLAEAFAIASKTEKEIEYGGDDFIFNIHLRIGYKYGMNE